MRVMRVRNRALAGERLRFSPEQDGRPALDAVGDVNGEFEVPESWGRWLCNTPGWEFVAMIEPEPPKTVERAQWAPPPALTELREEALELAPDAQELEPEALCEQLGELEHMGKNTLIEYAEGNGIELSNAERKMRVSELRALIARRFEKRAAAE